MLHQEVRAHYAAGDYPLAHRRLLDAALDTRRPAIFREVLGYTDWLDAHPDAAQTVEAADKAMALLDKIETAGAASAGQNAGAHLLSVTNLGKRYERGNFSLQDVNLELDAGGIIGLVGENGNGKTTLLRLMPRS